MKTPREAANKGRDCAQRSAKSDRTLPFRLGWEGASKGRYHASSGTAKV